MTATVNVPQCSPNSFLDNVGSNNRNADPVKQILVQDAWLHSVNTIISARLRGGWVAGYLGPWQHQQHFRLEGPRDPPAASRQPPAAVVAQEILEGGRGCCCSARLCGPGNLRGGARWLVPSAWCADLMVCMYTPAPAAALPVELELLSECCVLSMAFLVHSLLLAAIITETSVANLGAKIEKLYSVGCGMVSALHIAPFISTSAGPALLH